MQNDLSRSSRAPAGNTATGWLKVIAMIFMLIDHIGRNFLWTVPELRILGRIAFPLYVWCMIVGFHYTRSVPKYLLRILVVGAVSQPLYVLALVTPWTKPNIFLTLFLGLCTLWGIREKKWYSQFWAPAAAMVLANLLQAEYGWRGILLFVLLYAVQDHRLGICAVMVSYFLFWGSSFGLTKSLLGIPVPARLETLPESISQILSPFLRYETYALLSLPFILIPFRKDLRMSRWIGYTYYPAHLVLLMILKAIF